MAVGGGAGTMLQSDCSAAVSLSADPGQLGAERGNHVVSPTPVQLQGRGFYHHPLAKQQPGVCSVVETKDKSEPRPTAMLRHASGRSSSRPGPDTGALHIGHSASQQQGQAQTSPSLARNKDICLL